MARGVNDRLNRIEAVLREHRLHEASCLVRKAQVHNARGQTYMFPGECDCWLGDHIGSSSEGPDSNPQGQ